MTKQKHFACICFAAAAAVMSVSVQISADSPRRFALAPKSTAAHVQSAPKVCFPALEEHFQWDSRNSSWNKTTSVEYLYDARGNKTRETIWEDGEGYRSIYTYDDLDRRSSVLRSDCYEGEADFTDYELVTYEYDSVVKDFVTLRMNYDREDDQWVPNYKSMKYSITRNDDGNITEMELQLPLFGEFVPAYRSTWGYGEGDTASEYVYDYYETRSNPAQWIPWDGVTYSGIEWYSTDGQMTGHINDLVTGANRISRAEVNYDGILDGYLLASYGTDGDYTLLETGLDQNEVWREHSQFTAYLDCEIDRRVSYSIIDYFNDTAGYTGLPEYVYNYLTEYDFNDDLVSENVFVTEADVTDHISGVNYSYEYDAQGNLTAMQLDEYDPDFDEYLPTTLIRYSDFQQPEAGVVSETLGCGWKVDEKSLSLSLPGRENVVICDMLGIIVKEVYLEDGGSISLTDLPAGIYVARAASGRIRSAIFRIFK